MKNVFARGNRKLPRTTAVFNMGPAATCPERKAGTCQLSCPTACYALKAERQYPNVRTFRTRQMKYWRIATPDGFVHRLKASTSSTVKTLRFNEAGGIASQKDIDKVADIARRLPNAQVYMYTSRRDLWEAGAFDNLPENVTVNGSGFMAHNAFVAVSKHLAVHAKQLGATVCAGDCRTCHICLKRHGATVYAPMH